MHVKHVCVFTRADSQLYGEHRRLFKIKGKYQYVGVDSGSFLSSSHPTTGKHRSIIVGSGVSLTQSPIRGCVSTMNHFLKNMNGGENCLTLPHQNKQCLNM